MKHVKALNKDSKLIKKLNQVNWYTEINNEPAGENKEDIIDKLSMYLKLYVMTLNHLKTNIVGYDEEQKANFMRVVQYLYGKYTLYHSLLYERDLNDEQYLYDEEMSNLTKEYNIKKSNMPLKNVLSVVDIFNGIIKKSDEENKKQNPDGGFDEVKTEFEKRGLEPIKPKGIGKEHDRDTVCIMHDGIPYHISVMKGKDRRTKNVFDTDVSEHHKNIRRYHNIVKPLFYKIKELTGSENLWVMEGGGGQVQMFFGDEKGYIAILYLDMRDTKKLPRYRTYTLQVNGNNNDKYFEGVKIPGIRISTNRSVYGDD